MNKKVLIDIKDKLIQDKKEYNRYINKLIKDIDKLLEDKK